MPRYIFITNDLAPEGMALPCAGAEVVEAIHLLALKTVDDLTVGSRINVTAETMSASAPQLKVIGRNSAEVV